jgi:hypothetical protein
MRKEILLAGSVGVGAGLMYILDPSRGRRRRAMLRGHTTHFVGTARVKLDKKARYFGKRARGLFAEAGAALRRDAVTDEVLVERVRAQLGRVVSRPCDVEVLAEEGRVTLRGVVRVKEVERLLRRVSRVRGVRGVECQLNVKGRRDGRRESGELIGANVETVADKGGSHPSMSKRLLATFVGSGLALYAARRGGVAGVVAGLVGTRVLRRGVLSHAARGDA